MNSDVLANWGRDENQLARPDLGKALRREVYAMLSGVLSSSDHIPDSSTRLTIQAHCLDVISALEDLIQRFGLDEMVQ